MALTWKAPNYTGSLLSAPSTGRSIVFTQPAIPKKQTLTWKAPNYTGSLISTPAPAKATTKTTAKPTTKKTTTTSRAATPVYQTVAAPSALAPAPASVNLDDLIKKYYDQTSGDVNTLYDKQKSSQLAALKAQRDAAIGQTKQDYYDKKNQADVVNSQNLQKLREIMAANGVSSSGENLTLNAQANSDRQNSLNTLNNEEQAKINDWNNPSRDQAIVDQVEAARTQALLNAKQNAWTRAWNEYGFNNLNAQQLASLGLNKYQIDASNASSSASNQALLDYYNSLGFNGGSGGGGFQSDLSQAIAKGVPASWAGALSELVRRESSYNSNAKNPKSSAYGYAQFLNSTRANYEKKTGLNYSNPVNQLIMMAQYVKDRYGTPQAALAFWDKNKYY